MINIDYHSRNYRSETTQLQVDDKTRPNLEYSVTVRQMTGYTGLSTKREPYKLGSRQVELNGISQQYRPKLPTQAAAEVGKHYSVRHVLLESKALEEHQRKFNTCITCNSLTLNLHSILRFNINIPKATQFKFFSRCVRSLSPITEMPDSCNDPAMPVVCNGPSL
ncbi:hypothetical protein OUZ56_010313 [Daphnia magna]|uniref:Uncharacterized protein n=1 Tax=Daphnia magna TaxID=35525 RepID=A0ABR0AIA0_9CRUS|nr:hypothetical protein OUZ56_010313 [Daphnia magna]